MTSGVLVQMCPSQHQENQSRHCVPHGICNQSVDHPVGAIRMGKSEKRPEEPDASKHDGGAEGSEVGASNVASNLSESRSHVVPITLQGGNKHERYPPECSCHLSG